MAYKHERQLWDINNPQYKTKLYYHILKVMYPSPKCPYNFKIYKVLVLSLLKRLQTIRHEAIQWSN